MAFQQRCEEGDGDLSGRGYGEVDDAVVCPGELGGVAEADFLAGREDGVKGVAGAVRGVGDDL